MEKFFTSFANAGEDKKFQIIGVDFHENSREMYKQFRQKLNFGDTICHVVQLEPGCKNWDMFLSKICDEIINKDSDKMSTSGSKEKLSNSDHKEKP